MNLETLCTKSISRKILSPLLLCLVLAGCSSVYFAALEKVGIAKRDLLAKRVRAAQESQTEAKDQFKSAIERFNAVLGKEQDGPLKDRYEALKSELDRSETKAKAVHDRIAAVESVSNALFDEWQDELDDYKNEALRSSSRRKLDTTKSKYEQMLAAMKHAESKIDPVLQPLRDDVLFLKHNLNAQAIDSLGADLGQVQTDVDSLIRELERSIAEADSFVKNLEAQG